MRFASTQSRSSHHAPDTLARPSHWAQGAPCTDGSHDPDKWFADGLDAVARAEREEAKRVCRRCPACSACLTAALERGEPVGVWGGLDPDERRELLLHPTVRVKAPTEEPADGPPQQHAATA
ncbi:WhiB family transcriptional regulator [Streptomyces scabiei]|uniref:WhiB family transcriptional regulator n=1 Tax=Streptomyces scabiei TaxID=1930 RepID=UPI0038F6BAB6